MATVGVKGLKISNLYTVVCVHVYADEVLFFYLLFYCNQLPGNASRHMKKITLIRCMFQYMLKAVSTNILALTPGSKAYHDSNISHSKYVHTDRGVATASRLSVRPSVRPSVCLSVCPSAVTLRYRDHIG